MKTIILLISLLSLSAEATPIFTFGDEYLGQNVFNIDKGLVKSFGIYKVGGIDKIKMYDEDSKGNFSYWSHFGDTLKTSFDSYSFNKDQGFSFYFETFNKTYLAASSTDNFKFSYTSKVLDIWFTNDFGNTSSVKVSNVVSAPIKIPEPSIPLLFSFAIFGIVILTKNGTVGV